jgi:basic membrane protein A and related proteins
VRKRWFSLALVVFVVAFGVLGASLRGDQASAKSQALGACLVTDIGGLNDKSFNHLAYVGLQTAQRKVRVTGRVIQSKSPADYIPNLSTCVQQGAAITIGVGFLMTDAMDAVASKFPSNKFAIVDVDVTGLKHKPKNVQGLLFKEQEAGYLVGYAAGLWTKLHPIDGQQVIGSVGGIKLPPVDRYIAGYQYGAKKADPGIKVLNDYSQDFVAQAKCKEKALNQIANAAGVVFQVAGQCGLGVLDAAKEKKVLGIGVDADQGYLGTHVMTSALKRVDIAVYSAIFAANKGNLKTGINAIFDAKKGGVGVGKWSAKVPASIRSAVTAQLRLLSQGKIKGIPQTVK